MSRDPPTAVKLRGEEELKIHVLQVQESDQV